MNPYLALLRVEFTVPGLLPAARCALTAPFHPYLIPLRGPSAVCSLLHWSWVSPPALPGTLPYGARTFLPSARLPEEDDDEAATVWSASARSIEGCAPLSPRVAHSNRQCRGDISEARQILS